MLCRQPQSHRPTSKDFKSPPPIHILPSQLHHHPPHRATSTTSPGIAGFPPAMLATAAIDAPTPASTLRSSPSLEDPSNQVCERLLGPQRSAPFPSRRAARDAPAVAALAARLVADNATAARDSIEAILSSRRCPPREW
ncbi:hypothetical protein GQ55_3G413700 [Panicum hallii var. hallii]|uniref:Uncharacterized protein n=1 Tax=Panicum hallii var. hallii TaxID=1504633 RepID=A0A2T7EH83_9POAL|nr:hypothetical protein GQ55_3G413700 [Panicum hallii var. hallii]